MNTSEAVAILRESQLTAAQAQALSAIVASPKGTADDAIAALRDAPFIPNPELASVREFLRRHRSTQNEEQQHADVGAVVTPEVEEKLVSLLHKAETLMDERKEPWTGEITFSATIRTDLSYTSSFTESYKSAKQGCQMVGGCYPEDEIRSGESTVSVSLSRTIGRDEESRKKIEKDLHDYLYRYTAGDEFFVDDKVRELHDTLTAIDGITAELNNQGFGDEEIYAFLESRHECLRKITEKS